MAEQLKYIYHTTYGEQICLIFREKIKNGYMGNALLENAASMVIRSKHGCARRVED